MPKYSDEQYEMIKDSREKKSIAASAFKQRTHCGKCGGVRLPSDFMSKKELKAMNGECVTYHMNEPILWDVFKNWPEEHQKTYVLNVREKFKVPNTALAEAMGTSEYIFRKYAKCLGLCQGREVSGANRVWHDSMDAIRFWAWWNGEETPDDVIKPDLRKPMSWCVFKSLDPDSQISYIEWIREYFMAPDKHIADTLFKVSAITMRKVFAGLGIDSGKEASGRGRKAWNKESFIAWCEQDKKEPVADTDAIFNRHVEALEKAEQEIAVCESRIATLENSMVNDEKTQDVGPIAFTGNQIPVIPKLGSMTFENNFVEDILTTMKTLLGYGRVTMTVSWEYIPEDGICESY